MKDGEGPLLEEKCRAFGKDTFAAVKFLHEKVGMAHNDIHGSSFHRNYLWLEMMITIHIKYDLLLLLLLLLAAMHRPYPKISALKLFFCSYSK